MPSLVQKVKRETKLRLGEEDEESLDGWIPIGFLLDSTERSE